MTEIATIDWFGRWGTSVFSENTAIFDSIKKCARWSSSAVMSEVSGEPLYLPSLARPFSVSTHNIWKWTASDKELVLVIYIWQRQVLSWCGSCSMTKPTKWPVRPAKTDQPGHLVSIYPVWSVFAVRSVGGCPGWILSSLGAQIIFLVLSWDGSYLL